MTRPLVLVVEDDAQMRGVLRLALESHGYAVVAAENGAKALAAIGARPPDAMILDLGLPDIDGIEITARVREEHNLPIIVLSARGEEEHQIRALDQGANDYVTKPFREGELMARIRAALRRPAAVSDRREIVVGDLRIDPIQRRLFVADVEIGLTPTEFKLLHLLARNLDRVVTRHQLLREVWGPNRIDEVQYLRVYMKQLRQKIERDPAHPTRIVTALGVGYRLVATPLASSRVIM
jgi:two-component system, OmpR family, KDP operon response regulator KdpE